MIDMVQVSAGVAIGATAVGIAVWGMRAAMADTFVTRSDHDALEAEVTSLAGEVSTIKVNIATMHATLVASRESNARVEHMVNILVQFSMGKKAGELGGQS